MYIKEFKCTIFFQVDINIHSAKAFNHAWCICARNIKPDIRNIASGRGENTFTAENLRRGAMLLAGIMNELNIPTLKKRYYFLSKGSHIAWVTGYVVSNISEKYRTARE